MAGAVGVGVDRGAGDGGQGRAGGRIQRPQWPGRAGGDTTVDAAALRTEVAGLRELIGELRETLRHERAGIGRRGFREG